MKLYEQAASGKLQGSEEAEAGQKDDGVVDAEFEEVKDDR